jgi:hypothetical protein
MSLFFLKLFVWLGKSERGWLSPFSISVTNMGSDIMQYALSQLQDTRQRFGGFLPPQNPLIFKGYRALLAFSRFNLANLA